MSTLDYEVCKSQYDKLTDKGRKVCDIIIKEHDLNEVISELEEKSNKLLRIIEAKLDEKKRTTPSEQLLLLLVNLQYILSKRLELVLIKLNQMNIRLYKASRQQRQQGQQRSKPYSKSYSRKQYKKRYRKY